MSYAVRTDGAGWRAASGPDDIGPSEVWQDEQPPVIAPNPPPVDAASVTMRQARLALLSAGKLDDVDNAINALPDPMRREAQIEWEFASTVEKQSPLIKSLASSIGLDAEGLTELFNYAATL